MTSKLSVTMEYELMLAGLTGEFLIGEFLCFCNSTVGVLSWRGLE